ncbi:MAG: hypothetical protein AB7O98_00525 [Hyphomonadaceae bacterium]
MMRALIVALIVLASCARPEAARCDLIFTRDIAFTGAATPDKLTVQAMGASCDKAIGLLTIRDAEGFPLWAWTSPLERAFGAVFAADAPEHMQEFLERWAEPVMGTTSGAPAWRELAAGQTTLDQLTYEDIRARDLPMLCHFSGTARQTCVFWEPAAGGAGHLLDRDIEETP